MNYLTNGVHEHKDEKLSYMFIVCQEDWQRKCEDCLLTQFQVDDEWVDEKELIKMK